MLITTFGPYRFGSHLPLSEPQMARLAGIFSHFPRPASSMLEGRLSVSFQRINGLGPVAVKQYRRGGLIRHLAADRYLGMGIPRSRGEYELLQTVRGLGIQVPEPLVFASRGRLVYRAWLVTREIPRSQTLSRLSLNDQSRARLSMKTAIGEVSRLIHNRVLHVDLHPGNVVVDQNGRVFLVDFDKGHLCRSSKEKLKAHYIARWRRAVIKHNLPRFLGEMMEEGL